jgi:hypothetical protein
MLTISSPSGPRRVRRSTLFGALALAGAAGIAACHSSSPETTATTSAGEVASNPASSTISSLMSSVPGLSSSQASVGAGSMLGLAQAKMPSNQFSQVATAIPGTSSLIGSAQKAGLPGASSLTSLASITPLLSKAGLSTTQIGQLGTSLGSMIGAKGGPDLATSFLSAIK